MLIIGIAAYSLIGSAVTGLILKSKVEKLNEQEKEAQYFFDACNYVLNELRRGSLENFITQSNIPPEIYRNIHYNTKKVLDFLEENGFIYRKKGNRYRYYLSADYK